MTTSTPRMSRPRLATSVHVMILQPFDLNLFKAPNLLSWNKNKQSSYYLKEIFQANKINKITLHHKTETFM